MKQTDNLTRKADWSEAFDPPPPPKGFTVYKAVATYEPQHASWMMHYWLKEHDIVVIEE